jgi:hypothetical protein
MCTDLVSDAHYVWGVNTNFFCKHVDLYVLKKVIAVECTHISFGSAHFPTFTALVIMLDHCEILFAH